uniref:Candidate secreted effector n=1 Tax=Meloidogyne incognita TaxID=6306 RepID=A0A914MR36_MELIC
MNLQIIFVLFLFFIITVVYNINAIEIGMSAEAELNNEKMIFKRQIQNKEVNNTSSSSEESNEDSEGSGEEPTKVRRKREVEKDSSSSSSSQENSEGSGEEGITTTTPPQTEQPTETDFSEQ